jgi:hypothetical protein
MNTTQNLNLVEFIINKLMDNDQTMIIGITDQDDYNILNNLSLNSSVITLEKHTGCVISFQNNHKDDNYDHYVYMNKQHNHYDAFFNNKSCPPINLSSDEGINNFFQDLLKGVEGTLDNHSEL